MIRSMRITTVKWEDLLARHFQFGGRGDGPLDCAGVAEVIIERAGLAVPGKASLPIYAGPRTAPAALDKYLSTQAAKWQEIDRAQEVGDIVTSDPDNAGRPTHVSVVVDISPMTFLSATRGFGVTASERVKNPCHAYRLKEAIR